MQILLENNGVFEEVENIYNVFDNLSGVKNSAFSKNLKIIDDDDFNRIFIKLISDESSEGCKKINNYYKINDCIGINFSSQNNENILYSEEAVVIKNIGKECQLKINIIFLEDNYDGIELSNTTNISINIF